MANTDEQMKKMKKTAAKVLVYVEKAASFAASIDPMFGIVSSLVGAVRKGLGSEEVHAADKDFQAVHSKLTSISEQNRQCLQQIRIDEVNQNYRIYEERIKHQYEAFNVMVKYVKKDPENAQGHMDEYASIYENDKQDANLLVFYHGVMGMGTFTRPLLEVYWDDCKGECKIMEHRCSHLGYLFQIGLIALMAYTAVTEDDEDEVRKKWGKRMEQIQNEMLEVLSQCTT